MARGSLEVTYEATAPGRIPDNLQNAVDCDVPLPRTCAGLHDAYCGLSWSEFESFRLFNQPILDLARTLEESKPGAAEELLGAFQNDFDDVAEAMLACVLADHVLRHKAQCGE